MGRVEGKPKEYLSVGGSPMLGGRAGAPSLQTLLAFLLLPLYHSKLCVTEKRKKETKERREFI